MGKEDEVGERCPECKKITEFGEHAFRGFARTETGAIRGENFRCAKCGNEWTQKLTGIPITPGCVLVYAYLMWLSIVISMIIVYAD